MKQSDDSVAIATRFHHIWPLQYAGGRQKETQHGTGFRDSGNHRRRAALAGGAGFLVALPACAGGAGWPALRPRDGLMTALPRIE